MEGGSMEASPLYPMALQPYFVGGRMKGGDGANGLGAGGGMIVGGGPVAGPMAGPGTHPGAMGTIGAAGGGGGVHTPP